MIRVVSSTVKRFGISVFGLIMQVGLGLEFPQSFMAWGFGPLSSEKKRIRGVGFFFCGCGF